MDILSFLRARKAERKADNVQSQLNQAIQEGDQLAETQQARVDDEGISHDTLNTRITSDVSKLKQKDIELSAQLAQKANQVPYMINVKEYGVKGDGNTNDAPAIQSVINSAPNGCIIYFPNGVYKLERNNDICFELVEKKYITLIGFGAKFDVSLNLNSGGHLSIIGVKSCKKVVIEGFEFECQTFNTPSVRRNVRLISVTTSQTDEVPQEDLLECDDVIIRRNIFKINHNSTYNQNIVALYGIHAHTPATGKSIKVKNIKVYDNTFIECDGRIVQTYLVNGFDCYNNNFLKCGVNSFYYVIRMIGATKNANIYHNFIECVEGVSGINNSPSPILLTGGITGAGLPDSIASQYTENIRVFKNEITIKHRFEQTLIQVFSLRDVKNVKIEDNNVVVLEGSGTSIRSEGVRISTTYLPSRNVEISHNTFDSIETWYIRINDSGIEGLKIERNNFINDKSTNQFFGLPETVRRKENFSETRGSLERNGGVFEFTGNRASVEILHGLSGTPTLFGVTPNNDSFGEIYIKYVVTSGSRLTVHFSGTLPQGNIKVIWWAEL